MLPKLSSRPTLPSAVLLSSTTRIDPGLCSAASHSLDLALLCPPVSEQSLVIDSIRRECLDSMIIFNERHLRRGQSLYVGQCGSSGEPAVAIMQSADLRYSDDISLPLPVYESDAGTPRRSPLLRANLDEGRRSLRPARIHREAPPRAPVTARRSVPQFQREPRAITQWLLRHPIGCSTENPRADHFGHAETVPRKIWMASPKTIITWKLMARARWAPRSGRVFVEPTK